MRFLAWVGALLGASVAFGGTDLKLSLLPDDESIYALPEPPRENEGVNAGGVNLDFTVRYMSDYVYRGVDKSETGGHEDAPNVQFDGKLTFDFGKAPHLFLGTFFNIYDSDPISRFQEIRPTIGLEWTIRPIILSGGHISYIFPEREEQNTSEIFGMLQIDDSYFLRTDKPILKPYLYLAYDYDLNNGWYFQTGVEHELEIPDTGLTFLFHAEVAFVVGNQQYATTLNRGDTGFQHYEVGVTGSYSLNTIANLPRRYGDFSLQGYLNYTDGIRNVLDAETQLWGGVGIKFRY